MVTSPSIDCPLCEKASERLFEVHGYWVRRCTACGHRFAELDVAPLHVESVYGDAYFEGGGAGYPDYLAEGEAVRRRGQRYAGLLSKHASPGRMLDVGAAAGFFAKGFADAGWTPTGVEPNPTMASHGRERLGLSMHTGPLETVPLDTPFDLVGMVQVLPHFYDIRRALKTAERLTKPGGLWLIETWDRDALVARLFGRRWHEYSPPSVLHWFSRASVVELLARSGFRVVASGRAIKWISVAHVRSLLRHTAAGGVLMKIALALTHALPDHWALPYPGDDLFWVLAKKDG